MATPKPQRLQGLPPISTDPTTALIYMNESRCCFAPVSAVSNLPNILLYTTWLLNARIRRLRDNARAAERGRSNPSAPSSTLIVGWTHGRKWSLGSNWYIGYSTHCAGWFWLYGNSGKEHWQSLVHRWLSSTYVYRFHCYCYWRHWKGDRSKKLSISYSRSYRHGVNMALYSISRDVSPRWLNLLSSKSIARTNEVVGLVLRL